MPQCFECRSELDISDVMRGYVRCAACRELWRFESVDDPDVIDEDGDIVCGDPETSTFRVIAQCVDQDDAKRICNAVNADPGSPPESPDCHPRDIGKDDARQRFDKAAVELARGKHAVAETIGYDCKKQKWPCRACIVLAAAIFQCAAQLVERM